MHRDDVRVIETSCEPRLEFEARAEDAIGRRVRTEDLEGSDHAEVEVHGLIDDARTAAACLTDDPVAGEYLAHGQPVARVARPGRACGRLGHGESLSPSFG